MTHSQSIPSTHLKNNGEPKAFDDELVCSICGRSWWYHKCGVDELEKEELK